MEIRKAKLSELCALVGVSFIGDDIEINGLNLCNRETKFESILGYTTNSKFFDAILSNLSIKALVLTEELYRQFSPLAEIASRKFSYIVTAIPEFLFYDIHNLLWKQTGFYNHFQEEPIIGKGCIIHPSAVIENGVVIGNNVQIGPNSVVRSGSVIDDNVYIGCCSVIGSEGFQGIKGYPKMIKHVGGTHLCHDVYVGDCTTVGNALFEGNTEIGAYSKLDNHVHFAHNCNCGEHCFITACSLLMGSTTLENNVWMAPNAVTMNGVRVYDKGFIGAMSMANKDVYEGEVVVGIPAKVLKKQ
jgi:UDP-3-O-[3-hydroxymyristoyl] glucosamine N-acyltransferase